MTLRAGVSLAVVVAALTTTYSSSGQAQRPYPTVAQCAAGRAANEVFIDSCGEGYRICPNGSKLGFSYCIPLSDREKADIRRQQDELQAKLAKEQAAKDEFDRQVQDEITRLGPHRRAEAESLVRMRQAAQAARPPPAVSTSRPAETVDCSRPATKAFEHWPYQDMQTINANYAAFDVNKMCGRRGGTKGALQCHRRWAFGGVQMGNCGVHWGCNAEPRRCPAGSKVAPQ